MNFNMKKALYKELEIETQKYVTLRKEVEVIKLEIEYRRKHRQLVKQAIVLAGGHVEEGVRLR